MSIDEFPKDHRNWTFSLTLTKMKEIKKSGVCFNNKILSDLLGVNFDTLGVIESDKITLAGSAEIIELVDSHRFCSATNGRQSHGPLNGEGSAERMLRPFGF